MSYILDALRRADAERQRGQVPGLAAQPAAVAADTDAPRRLPPWLLAAAAAVVVAAVAVLAIWRSQPAATPPAPAPAAALPAPARPQPALPVVVSAPPVPQQAAPQQAVQQQAVQSAPPAVALPPPAAAASRAEVAATPLSALSADQRRELPPLVLGGSIWSDSAAQRFVIINGQVVHEGESAANGVVVERITPRTAILRWRALRIELAL